ncbi:MAG: ImmA/IrrE family metallo-endopeptidase [Candidatus Desulforudis sp.]|nr:ImmA/IrrE family metallo-endopeptidase [Desulforudis sp.]
MEAKPLNADHTIEERYSTLAHELGHIFCGHLGVDGQAWWNDHTSVPYDAAEIEAESIAYLVCRRQGLIAMSERYLSADQAPKDLEMPFFSLNAVFQATDYYERMGHSPWKKPKKKPKSETPA